MKKGDVLGVARIAGIMASKRCADLIPLCHPIAITGVTVDVELVPAKEEKPDDLQVGERGHRSLPLRTAHASGVVAGSGHLAGRAKRMPEVDIRGGGSTLGASTLRGTRGNNTLVSDNREGAGVLVARSAAGGDVTVVKGKSEGRVGANRVAGVGARSALIGGHNTEAIGGRTLDLDLSDPADVVVVSNSGRARRVTSGVTVDQAGKVSSREPPGLPVRSRLSNSFLKIATTSGSKLRINNACWIYSSKVRRRRELNPLVITKVHILDLGVRSGWARHRRQVVDRRAGGNGISDDKSTRSKRLRILISKKNVRFLGFLRAGLVVRQRWIEDASHCSLRSDRKPITNSGPVVAVKLNTLGKREWKPCVIVPHRANRRHGVSLRSRVDFSLFPCKAVSLAQADDAILSSRTSRRRSWTRRCRATTTTRPNRKLLRLVAVSKPLHPSAGTSVLPHREAVEINKRATHETREAPEFRSSNPGDVGRAPKPDMDVLQRRRGQIENPFKNINDGADEVPPREPYDVDNSVVDNDRSLRDMEDDEFGTVAELGSNHRDTSTDAVSSVANGVPPGVGNTARLEIAGILRATKVSREEVQEVKPKVQPAWSDEPDEEVDPWADEPVVREAPNAAGSLVKDGPGRRELADDCVLDNDKKGENDGEDGEESEMLLANSISDVPSSGLPLPGIHGGSVQEVSKAPKDFGRIEISATVTCDGKTGVEMEALTAATVAALTAYDMCKAVDKGMVMSGVRVVEKKGGKSGDWRMD